MPTSKPARAFVHERFTATDSSQLTVPGYLPEGYVRIQTLAEILDVSVRTVESWVYQKKIPYIAISHKCLRFKVADVLRSLEDRFTVREISLSKEGGAA